MKDHAVVLAKDLRKVYGKKVAVERLSFELAEGEIFGFLGPNGAGKSTAILMILGLTEPTSGEAYVFGHNSTREAVKVRRITGYLPERIGFYEDLTARENLKYTAELNDIDVNVIDKKIDEVLEIVGLRDSANTVVRKFSKGMKQRLGIADVLIKDPKLMILDEPTSNLDPEGASQVLETIKQMNEERNITVLLSSHQLPMVQKICDKVIMLNEGKVIAAGSIAELGLMAMGEGKHIIELEISGPAEDIVEKLRQMEGVLSVESKGNQISIVSSKDIRPQIARTVVDSNVLLVEMKLREYALEEIYMKYFHKEGIS